MRTILQNDAHLSHQRLPILCEGRAEPSFVSKAQRRYIAASYDAFGRAVVTGQNTSLDLADVTDAIPAWHYSEEKQQTHFKCQTDGCGIETDILGLYGYCPRCGRTSARPTFNEAMARMLARWEQADKNVNDRNARGEVWEDLTTKAVTEFEALAKHLRRRLLTFPMTHSRRQQLEELNFQRPLQADVSLRQWFDIGIVAWDGNAKVPPRAVRQSELPFITKMIQRRHILIHNGGVVDADYLELSGDTQSRLDERIRVSSRDARHFVEVVSAMGLNLLDGVEYSFEEA